MNLDDGNDRKLQTELKQSSHYYWGVFNVYCKLSQFKNTCTNVGRLETTMLKIFRGEDSQLQ